MWDVAQIVLELYSPSLPAPLLRTSVAFGGDDGIGISATKHVLIWPKFLI
jgi:hypothetical protein